jgi:hypothetical protein
MMGVVLTAVEFVEFLEHGHAAGGFARHGVDQHDALAPLHGGSPAQEVRTSTDHLDILRQTRVRRESLRGVEACSVVAHQRIAEADDEDRLHRRWTRWTEHEMHGS